MGKQATMSGSDGEGSRSGQPPAVTLRIGLYVVAALAAGGFMFVAPALKSAVSRGAVDPIWLNSPLVIYCLFVIVYGMDRLWLVRRRRYPAGKALFQMAFAAIFALVLPNALLRVPATEDQKTAKEEKHKGFNVLQEERPEIRRNFVHATGYRGLTRERVNQLVLLLDDADQTVNSAALEVLREWSGKPNEQISGIRAWASALSNTSTISGREQNE